MTGIVFKGGKNPSLEIKIIMEFIGMQNFNNKLYCLLIKILLNGNKDIT